MMTFVMALADTVAEATGKRPVAVRVGFELARQLFPLGAPNVFMGLDVVIDERKNWTIEIVPDPTTWPHSEVYPHVDRLDPPLVEGATSPVTLRKQSRPHMVPFGIEWVNE